jgi:hypothetical protein
MTEDGTACFNFNLDYSIVKLEAPKEFETIGLTLSKKRKIDAEGGSLHRTARRLGALFEGAIPPADALYRAYGTRVSEISSSIPVYQSFESSGFFVEQLGADLAGIWAAATSGPVAIALHLLACMLARYFAAPKATAIWSKLVEERRHQLITEAERAYNLNDLAKTALMAAHQDITQTDLSQWDASARSWIQTADSAKSVQQKQLVPFLHNVTLANKQEDGVYLSIITALTQAMSTMNSLLIGRPQQIKDEFLLAMLAWHLYPEMLVLGPNGAVGVKQSDPLFAQTAVLTIDLKGGGNQSDSWSLPLNNLEAYADSTLASKSMPINRSRITFSEFQFVVMGSIFGGWKSAPGWEGFECTLENGIGWIRKLIGCFAKDDSIGRRATTVTFPYWLRYLYAAGETFLECDNELEKRVMRQLFSLGARRVDFFLSGSDRSPLFGLSLRSVISGLLLKGVVKEKVLARYGSGLLNMEETLQFLSNEADTKKVKEYLSNSWNEPRMPEKMSQVLRAFAAAARLYEAMPDATISALLVSGKPFGSYLWCVKHHEHDTPHEGVISSELPLRRTQALSCIIMFESSCDIDPAMLEHVFALSSGDAIYVAEELLLDPFCTPSMVIRRLTGNIGRPGVSLLVPPPDTKVRSPDPESWIFIQHAQFDGTAGDYFRNTSVHMSFTEYKMPIVGVGSGAAPTRHIIDSPITLVETILSVHDSGKWVADLDVLKVLDTERPNSNVVRVNCANNEACQKEINSPGELISIDCWDELLDYPSCDIVIRASGNSLARLVLTAICVKLGFQTLVLPDEYCWACCCEILESKSSVDDETSFSHGRKAIILGSRRIDV